MGEKKRNSGNNKKKIDIENIVKNLTLNEGLVGGILFILLMLTFAAILDFGMFSPKEDGILASVIMGIRSFFEDICDSNNYIMDAFSIIWSMTITVFLLFIEMQNTHWYGVTLKRIIKLTLDKITIFGISILYIVLFPAVYIAEARKLYFLLLWGIVCTLAAFVLLPVVVLSATSKKQIIKLLNHSTIEQFHSMINEFEKRMALLDSEKKWKDINIAIELEKLSITDMIGHVNYEDTVDVEQLLNTLADLFIDKRILNQIQDTIYEHIVIMMWTDKIIEKSGLESYQQRNRTLYIIMSFWEKLQNSIQDTVPSAQNEASCFIELLLPLLRRGTAEAESILDKLLAAYIEMKPRVMVNLLLYLEFLHCNNRRGLEEEISFTAMTTICTDLITLQKACAAWDREEALEFWMSWASFRNLWNDTEISYFLDFSKDVKYIAQNRMYKINTYTMRKIKVGMEK